MGDEAHPDQSLTSAQRLLIKRAKISVSIILKESDDMAKFELFQRLNTGGSMLSDQEVRNSILVMMNTAFYRWLRQLSEDQNFSSCVALSDRAVEEQYDIKPSNSEAWLCISHQTHLPLRFHPQAVKPSRHSTGIETRASSASKPETHRCWVSEREGRNSIVVVLSTK
jgi:hypothetical protein